MGRTEAGDQYSSDGAPPVQTDPDADGVAGSVAVGHARPVAPVGQRQTADTVIDRMSHPSEIDRLDGPSGCPASGADSIFPFHHACSDQDTPAGKTCDAGGPRPASYAMLQDTTFIATTALANRALRTAFPIVARRTTHAFRTSRRFPNYSSKGAHIETAM